MRILVASLVLSLALFSCTHQRKKEVPVDISPESSISWEYADSIRNVIQPVDIPSDTFRLKDGSANDPQGIQKAIDNAFEQGGGTIIIPRGIYSTGPIVLKSKINLHLEEGACPQIYFPNLKCILWHIIGLVAFHA